MANYNCQQYIYPHGIYDTYNNNYLDFSKDSTQNASTQFIDSEQRYRNCLCECHQRCVCNCQCCSKNFCSVLEELNELRCNYRNVIDEYNKLKCDKISTDSYINELKLENKRMRFHNLNINVGEENEKLKHDMGRYNEMLEQIFHEVLEPLSNKINNDECRIKEGYEYYFDKNYEFYKILNLFKKYIQGDNKSINQNDKNYQNNNRENINKNIGNYNYSPNNKYNNFQNQYNIPYINQNIPNNKPLTFGNNEPNSQRGQNSPNYINDKINYQDPYMNSKYHLEKEPNSLMNSINSQNSNINFDNPNLNNQNPEYINNNKQINYQEPNNLMNSINSQDSNMINNQNNLNNSETLNSNFDVPKNAYNKYYPNNKVLKVLENKNKKPFQNKYQNNEENENEMNQPNKKIKAVIKDQTIDSYQNNIDYQKYGRPIDSIEQDNEIKEEPKINKDKNRYFENKNNINNIKDIQNDENIENDLQKSGSFNDINQNIPFNQTFKEDEKNKKQKIQNQKKNYNINKNKPHHQRTNSTEIISNNNKYNNLYDKNQNKKNIINPEKELGISFEKKHPIKKILIPIKPKKKISPYSYELSNNNINVERYNSNKEKDKIKKLYNTENALFYNPDPFTVHLRKMNKINKMKKSSSTSRKDKENENSIYFPDGSCWACDLGCSISLTGYSPMTYSPYNKEIKRRNITPVKPGTKYEEYLRHKKINYSPE